MDAGPALVGVVDHVGQDHHVDGMCEIGLPGLIEPALHIVEIVRAENAASAELRDQDRENVVNAICHHSTLSRRSCINKSDVDWEALR